MKDVVGNDDHHKERKGGLFIPVDMHRSIADKLPCLDSIFPLLRVTHIADVPRAMSASDNMEKRP
jgi:hypothetical protein